jgi:hypothetical protein
MMKKSLRFKTVYVATVILTLLLTTFVGVCGSPQSHAATAGQASSAWSFGVMGDTQWTLATDPAGNNPNGVPVSIIDQINQQFINKGVKFVIQVGDLTENGNNADVAKRAIAVQALYDAGIGFFPMRGNHETCAKPDNGYVIAAFQNNFPQTKCLSNTFGAANCSSPSSVTSDLTGMSYSFDYGPAASNVRFVIIDNWATPSKRIDAAGYLYGYSISDQQSWINSRLDKNNRDGRHVFVFSHQPLIAENHQDSLFSGYTNANPDMQNAFLASLQNNNVKYFISGHDHIHQRSIITSPDGISKIQELICASNSSKFYTPKPLTDSKWYGQKSRETSVSQELQTVGYYIFTVDGPRVTVDYYSDNHGGWLSDEEYPAASGNYLTNKVTPAFNFIKKATWGYSLNGKEFLVGGTNDNSFTVVQDRFGKTSAKILSGTYSNKATDYNGRILTQTVNTGWSPKTKGINSDILTLWGMAGLGTGQTCVFTLSLSYDHNSVSYKELKRGLFGMVTKDTQGNWVNAVDKNFGGKKKFVYGPWLSDYELGTYGVDPHTKNVWAVINYNGDFAAAQRSEKHQERHKDQEEK